MQSRKRKFTVRVLSELPTRDVEELDRYIAIHGKHWRQALQREWESGSHILRRLRNHFGPKGLKKLVISWQRSARSRRVA